MSGFFALMAALTVSTTLWLSTSISNGSSSGNPRSKHVSVVTMLLSNELGPQEVE
ncbi:hypothetical protein PF008_g23442 [Phytophthora fragariae]|uniref:RxLR effector protein n=1 Tax=Phytophthora fragariae TaxID=53985 RepID=A0A6G0QQY7_9STRA|nr:hypothetical protein PF008_g23442 [Phytophthora fragariae]